MDALRKIPILPLGTSLILTLSGCSPGADPSAGGDSPAPSPAPPGTNAPAEQDAGGASDPEAALAQRASRRVTERRPDSTSSGDVSGYPELIAASVTGTPEAVRVVMSFADPVPQQVADGTRMLVSASFTMEDGARYVLNGLAAATGWRTISGGTSGRTRFPGDFVVSEDEVRMSIPWSELGGPRSFRWIVSSSWSVTPTRGAAYAFDSIPNRGFARFP